MKVYILKVLDTDKIINIYKNPVDAFAEMKKREEDFLPSIRDSVFVIDIRELIE